MNTTLRTLATLAALGLPFAASADTASIDYRHQYTDSDRAHADRIKLNYRLASGLGFEAEMKYRTAGDRRDVAYDNMVNNGEEFTVSYNYTLNPQATLTPAFQMDSSSDATTYKFGLKYKYRINDRYYVATRYRLDTKKLNRDAIDEDMADNAKNDQHVNRFEGWLGYTPASKWAYEYQFIYFKTDYIRYANKKDDYEQNLIIKYALTRQWVPFMEIGDIKVDTTSDDRQVRWRLGVVYNFM
ncbi:oligogalacturonate-specific porin KdgM family protein [Pseudomonas sp. App30]|uniref:oligogalacturonate-specific porin KdgM family protein n=1 Tax=Pseudomonas sp. App30 TaxID=3068990 RepID=UPI003A801700